MSGIRFSLSVRQINNKMIMNWLLLFFMMIVCVHGASQNSLLFVNITLLENAVADGAVCTDGSPAAYYWDKGYGSGKDNWLISLEGGGWCNDAQTCKARSGMFLGSSTKMEKTKVFTAILNNNPQRNPDFYNWNRVFVAYCDGSSFTGDAVAQDPTTKLYFRGYRVWRAVMKDLLGKGMNKANKALLTGCSAGGLATLLHCDEFRSLLPRTAKVKCMPDAGYFINGRSIDGLFREVEYFRKVAAVHKSYKHLPVECTSKLHNPGMCYLPQNFVQYIKTPLFIVNSAIDSWQIRSILAPLEADPKSIWKPCKENVIHCSTEQISQLNDYRKEFLDALAPAESLPSVGMFINSCYAHCQTTLQATWHSPNVSNSPKLNGMTIAQAAGDWFYERKQVKEVDCPFPCDSTCRNFHYIIRSSTILNSF